jgi:hypothetical protein
MARSAIATGVVLALLALVWLVTRSEAPRALDPVAPEEVRSAALHSEGAPPVDASASARASAARATYAEPSNPGTIRGRGIDDAGNALDLTQARACLEYVRNDASGRARLAGDPLPLNVTAGKDGRFQLDVPSSSFVRADRSVALTLTLRPSQDTLRGTLTVPHDLSPQFDAGDVVLAAPPVALEGVIVSERGEPVANASLKFERTNEEALRDAMRFGTWTTCYSDARGHFVVRRWTDEERLAATIAHERFQPNRVEGLVPGTRDVRIVLSTAIRADLHIRIAIDDESMLDRISVIAPGVPGGELQPARVFGSQGPARTQAVRSLFILRLRPGDCAVELRTTPGDILIDRIEHVNVEEKKTNTDPRLDPIDLRGKLEWVDVTLRDHNGGPYRWSVQLEVGTSTPLSVRPDKEGKLRVLGVVGGPRWSIRPAGGQAIDLWPGRVISMPAN